MTDLKFADGVPIRMLGEYATVLEREAVHALAAHDMVCCWEDLVITVGSERLAVWHRVAASETGVVFGPDDERRTSAERVAGENMFTRDLVGVRTNCFTGVESAVELKAMLTRTQSGLWLHLTAGSVTGCESARFDELSRDWADPEWSGWAACCGTPNRYDRLVVSAWSLRDVYGTVNPDQPHIGI